MNPRNIRLFTGGAQTPALSFVVLFKRTESESESLPWYRSETQTWTLNVFSYCKTAFSVPLPYVFFFSPTGMIAIDQDGHVAAGTSTNGLTHKVPGYAGPAGGAQTQNAPGLPV